MQVYNIEQGSSEWHDLRNKYPLTASEAQAIGNQGKGLETLIWKKLAERYSSADKDNYTNKDLDRGKELEPLARDMYELRTGYKVEKVGFVTDENISKVGGASPDSLVNDDGLLEIKCLNDDNHFQAIIEKKKNDLFKIDSGYMWQMQMQMLFTGRKWCDYLLYNPNYPESLLIYERIIADEKMQNDIREGLKKGEQLINEIEKIYVSK